MATTANNDRNTVNFLSAQVMYFNCYVFATHESAGLPSRLVLLLLFPFRRGFFHWYVTQAVAVVFYKIRKNGYR